MDELEYQRRLQLDDRRRRLASLLAEEEEAYSHELVALQDTPEARRSRIAEKARALYAAREARRKAEAERLLTEAFRINCDSVRALDSHARLTAAVAVRGSQLREKAIIAEEERAYHAKAHQDYEQLRLAKEARHRKDLEDAAARFEAQKEIIEAQRRAKQVQIANAAEELEKDRTEMREMWDALDRAEEDRKVQDFYESKRRLADIVASNDAKLARDAALRAQEEAEEYAMVQAALKTEAELDARDAAARELRKQEMIEYRKDVERQMNDKAEEDASDELRAAKEAAEQQAKQDAVWAAQDAARAALMEDVIATREQQVADRVRGSYAAVEEKALERQMLDAEMEELAIKENERRNREKLERIGNRLDIEQQIWAKQEMQRLETARIEDDRRKKREDEEELHRMTMKVTAQKATMNFGRKNAQWFY